MAAINLGLLHNKDLIEAELTWEGPSRLKKLTCGGNHSVLLMDDGRLFGCGDNSQGQLGAEEEGRNWIGWRRMKGRFHDVACGWESTVVIDTNNQLLARGRGLKGELGIAGIEKFPSHFLKVMNVSDGARLFASFQNCVVVEQSDKETRIFGWGSNTKCQIREPKCKVLDRPHLIYANCHDVTIDYVTMGKDFMIIVDDHGYIREAHGRLPGGFKIEDWQGKSVRVSCMWSSLHILYNHSIHSYGNGNHGQLYDVKCPVKIDSFTTGSEHGVLIHNKYHVSCWGWGEHGNCGHPTRRQGPRTGYPDVNPINDIFTTDSNVKLRVYGGYASTWIVCEC